MDTCVCDLTGDASAHGARTDNSNFIDFHGF